MRELARRTGVKMSINLNQPADDAELWRETLTLIEESAKLGEKIEAQVAGRSIGLIMFLQGTVHPLMMHNAYLEVANLPIAQRAAALADPARRAR
jgi:hypothetical protein